MKIHQLAVALLPGLCQSVLTLWYLLISADHIHPFHIEILLTGVGVNVANKYRTATNIDGIIDAYNASEKEHIDHISVTWMVARVCSETELLIG